MNKFNSIISEINSNLGGKLPEMKDLSPDKPKDRLPTNNLQSKKRNENDQSKRAGKYFKSLDNTTGKVISDEDKQAATEKGSITQHLDNTVNGSVLVMSKAKFDRLLNDSGDRSLDLSDGSEKTLNSKTMNYTVKSLPSGRVIIRKTPNKPTP